MAPFQEIEWKGVNTLHMAPSQPEEIDSALTQSGASSARWSHAYYAVGDIRQSACIPGVTVTMTVTSIHSNPLQVKPSRRQHQGRSALCLGMEVLVVILEMQWKKCSLAADFAIVTYRALIFFRWL
jgi:hypothetical protein